MPFVTRRGFIKSTSVSLAAIGAVSALPALANGARVDQSPEQPLTGPMPMPPVPLSGGAPFMVYISDPSMGTGMVLVGEQAIPFTNGAIVQSLRQVIG